MAVLLFFLLFTSVLCENPYSFYMFENVESSMKLFNQEIQFLEELQDYKSVLEDTKQIIEDIKFHQPKDLLNPIDSTYRLYKNVFEVKLKLYKNFQRLKKFKFSPLNVTLNDYYGALNGILLLQDTYEFDINKLLIGSIEFIDHENNFQRFQSFEKLQIEDLIEIAKIAKEKKLYDKAILFMQTSNR